MKMKINMNDLKKLNNNLHDRNFKILKLVNSK